MTSSFLLKISRTLINSARLLKRMKISAAKVNWAKIEALAFGRWSAGLPQLPGGAELEEGGV